MEVLYVLLCLLGLLEGHGWGKLVNFYTRGTVQDTTLGVLTEELFVLVTDTRNNILRIPLQDVPYYRASEEWVKLNETLLMARLSYFVRDHANVEIEHDVLRFRGNMTLTTNQYSFLILVNDEEGLSGSMCNVGKRPTTKDIVVNLCLHGLREAGINSSYISVHASRVDCSNACRLYEIGTSTVEDSAQFVIPADGGTWNLTVNHRGRDAASYTTLCLLNTDLAAGGLYTVVMKPNKTISTMFECVLFADFPSTVSALAIWLPVTVILLIVVVLVVILVYRKWYINTPEIPPPDAAPYRCFAESTSSNSPTYASYRPSPDLKYFKTTPQPSEAHYERI